MMRRLIPAALLACAAAIACAQTASSDGYVKLSQIQVIGTHNSYHAGIAPSEAKLMQAKAPRDFAGLDYAHQPLTAQLDSGVRQIELDIFADTQGGRFAHPLGPQLVAAAQLPADPPFDPNGAMLKPGFKVLHVQDVDYRSTCEPFIACLTEVRNWSHAHPEHIPIFILVETKDEVIPDRNGMHFTQPEPYTAATFDALDAEIRSVFSPAEIITPDDVRGSHGSLNEAVLAGRWPTLGAARGKVIFLLDQRRISATYLAGHPALRGRVLFTNANPGDPDAAFIERNEGPASEIRLLVQKGYLVRARTDANTTEARSNDTRTRDAMMSSGAQLLSTDYPASEPARWPGHFTVALPDNAVARCNPVNTAACAPLRP